MMFSDEADVDSHPESQPLTNHNNNNINIPTTATATATATEDPLSLSLERQQQQQQQQQQQSPSLEQSQNVGSTTISPPPPPSSSVPPGLTDGFQTWSQTFEAFHAGIFHTVTYLFAGIVGYSFLLDTKWPIVDSMYFSVVLFTSTLRLLVLQMYFIIYRYML
jgi:hypothetical protein